MWQDRRPIVKGSTAPILQEVITEDNQVVVRNMTGWDAYVMFWYAGATAPHVVRAAVVRDPLNGIVEYEWEGDEIPTSGYLLYQFVFGLVGSTDLSVQEWGQISSGVFRREVLEAAA